MGYWKGRDEEYSERGFGAVSGSVCLSHIEDRHLSSALADDITQRGCQICGRAGSPDDEPFAVEVEALVRVFVEALRFHFADAETLPWDGEWYVGPVLESSDVVERLSDGVFDPEHEEAIIALISEAIGDDRIWTTWGGGNDTDTFEFWWDDYVETVKHVARFVVLGEASEQPGTPSASVAFLLSQLLAYVDGDLGLVRDLAPATSFFRGRLTERPKEIRRDAADLGPAPPDKATANRMSPAGIAFFYASSDADTAVAEIAGHGVAPYAVVAEFKNLKPIRVLDLTLPPTVPSPFDTARRREGQMAAFLKLFVSRITQPVIPDGRQHVEYTPTQVLTEYLRWAPGRKIEGLVLPSAHTGRPTYVLFFGPDAFTTLGLERTPPGGRKVLGLDQVEVEPALQLDPKDVSIYEVHRRYTATPAGGWVGMP